MRVLVTGAASGFGAAVSAELLGRGAYVRGIDLQPGPGIHIADLRSEEEIERVVPAAISEMGGLDVLINNAGIGGPSDAGSPPDEYAVATLEVNLLAPWRVTAAALPALLESRGRVLNVSSALAFVNVPFSAAYCASKRGLSAYSDTLRLQYGDRIGVTTVYPGYVNTPIHQRSESLGFTLAGAVPEDSLAGVVKVLADACFAKRAPRDVATSRLTKTGIFFARHFPGLTDAATRRQMKRLERRGHFSRLKLPSDLSDRSG